MSTIAEALNIAIQHHQAGDLQRAEMIYRQVLQVDPAQGTALHFLGVIAHQVGRQDVAIDFMQRSLAVMPFNEGFHCNLGLAYQAAGKNDEAIASYKEALRLNVNCFDAHNNLANALAGQGKTDEAIAGYQHALMLNPESAEAHSNLGVALQRFGNLDEAESHCRKGVRIKPDSVEARINLGNVQAARGKLEDSVLNFREAIRLRPDNAMAYNNLGGTLQLQGKMEEAVESYRKALSSAPNYPEAHGNLACALQAQGNLDDAESHLREALRLLPGMAAANNNLGGVLQLEGRFSEAIPYFREALRLSPNDSSPFSNILLCMNYDPHTPTDALFAEHRRWGEAFEQVADAGPAANHDRNPTRRLRIGYVSPDLSWHPIAHFLQPILANHDPDQAYAICYAEVFAADDMTARLKSLSREWHSLTGLNDVEAAKLLRDHKIDILIDLAGHTAKSRLRLFAHRPAPVQVSYLGYPGTTGLAAIDYRLTDEIADPPGEAVCHTEELVRLPQGFCCYSPPVAAPAINPLPAKQNGYITFGSLHALHRLNDDVLDLWSRVLRAVPTSHLLIFRHTLQGQIKERLHRQLTDRGIEPSRIDLRSDYARDGGNRYLSVYHNVDISLDTLPWSGHTTSCESLWMGAPVITLRGNRHAGRMVASVLTHVGLPELIAETPEQYVEIAERLAGDIDRLEGVRAGLRDKMSSSPLCDGKGFTKSLEAAYRTMWQKWCGSEKR